MLENALAVLLKDRSGRSTGRYGSLFVRMRGGHEGQTNSYYCSVYAWKRSNGRAYQITIGVDTSLLMEPHCIPKYLASIPPNRFAMKLKSNVLRIPVMHPVTTKLITMARVVRTPVRNDVGRAKFKLRLK